MTETFFRFKLPKGWVKNNGGKGKNLLVLVKGDEVMCGITGWIDFNGDLADQGKIIEEMTQTLHKRGPDATGTYMTTEALLGHRRLTVVDPEGGAQPMIRTQGDNRYIIVYNGELYNTEEIRDKLLQRGYQFESYSDTEVLLTAFIEWGPDCVKELNGIFAFGVVDEGKKRLFLARDPLGVKPLFYTNPDKGIAFSSELKALLAHPLVKPRIGPEGILELIGLGPGRSPGKAVFDKIHEVPPGHWLLFTREQQLIREYWQLESRPHEDSLDQTTDKVRELLVDSIERQLVSDVPLCTFLSGGLDSSAISAVAARAFEKQNRGPLHTFSIDYLHNERYFRASEFQPNSDKIWIDRMVSYIGSTHHHVILETDPLIAALKDAVHANDLPGMADVDSSLYLFCKAVKEQATVALSGECADEIFGGYPWFRRREDIQANTFPWSRAIKERISFLRDDFKGLPLEEYVQERYHETLREVPRLMGESPEAHRMREITYLNLRWFMITLLNRKDRMSMAHGLEVRVPFADHRIMSYAWNIPMEMKYLGGREKGLLRNALKGILHEDVLERKKSPYPKTHHPDYLKGVRRELKILLGDKQAPLWQIISKHRVWELVNSQGEFLSKPWFGQLMTEPQLMAYLLQLNYWMITYQVELI